MNPIVQSTIMPVAEAASPSGAPTYRRTRAAITAIQTAISLVVIMLAAAPVATAQVTVTVTNLVESAKQTEPTPADLVFFAMSAQRAAYEAALADLAAAKASSEKMQRYDQAVAADDRAYLQALRDLAQQCYRDLSAPLSDDEQQRIAELRNLSGAKFDRAYADAAGEANDADKYRSDFEVSTTFNPHIRELIVKYRHIKQSLQEQLSSTGSLSPSSSATPN